MVFPLVCYIATLFSTETVYQKVALIGLFLILAGGERKAGMIYFVMEAYKCGLLGALGRVCLAASQCQFHAVASK
jgi:hypothetical protein